MKSELFFNEWTVSSTTISVEHECTALYKLFNILLSLCHCVWPKNVSTLVEEYSAVTPRSRSIDSHGVKCNFLELQLPIGFKFKHVKWLQVVDAFETSKELIPRYWSCDSSNIASCSILHEWSMKVVDLKCFGSSVCWNVEQSQVGRNFGWK